MVANYANVSKSAVSKVLLGGGGKTTKVGEKTAGRIRQAAKFLGFHPDWAARSLKTGKTNNIGLLWSLSYPHYATGIVRNFSSHLMGKGYSTTIIDSLSDLQIIKQALSGFISRKVDGLIFQAKGCAAHDPEIEDMLGRIENVVVVSDQDVFPAFSKIILDFDPAFKEILQLAEKCGRFNITALINDSEAFYREKFRKYSGNLKLQMSNENLNNYENPEVFAEKIVKQYPDTDLFFALSDLCAQAISSQIIENGREVPEDVGVIGFNDNPFGLVCRPPLASVKIDIDMIVDIALKIIFDNMKSETPHKRKYRIKAEFINRASSGLTEVR